MENVIRNDLVAQVSMNGFASMKLVCITTNEDDLVEGEDYTGCVNCHLFAMNMVSVWLGGMPGIYPLDYFEVIEVDAPLVSLPVRFRQAGKSEFRVDHDFIFNAVEKRRELRKSGLVEDQTNGFPAQTRGFKEFMRGLR